MADLVAGIAVLAALSVLCFVGGAAFGRRMPVGRVKVLGLLTSAAILAYIALLEDSVRLVTLLPVSNLIVVGNWAPLLLSLLAGLAWSLLPRQDSRASSPARDVTSPDRAEESPIVNAHAGRTISLGVRSRRFAVLLALEGVAWYTVIRPLWGAPPYCSDQWQGDVCVQTTDATCTPACAATLLKAHGIKATEPEMAGLCLTRRGTLWQGLYRGLKLKTAGTPWDVEVIHGPFAVLQKLPPGVAIIAARVPRDGQVAPIYTERYGWSPGEWHSVLFFGFRPNDRVAMGDPSPGIGREEWTEDDLRVLWGGRGMRLVRRER